MNSLREQVQAFQKRSAREYDPQDDTAFDNDNSSSDGEKIPNLNGREHYEEVGKSRLRKPEQSQLGTRYDGVAISRTDLDDADEEHPLAPVQEDDDNDPFAERSDHRVGPDSSEGSQEDEESDFDVDADDDEARSANHRNGLSTSSKRVSKLKLADQVSTDEDESESLEDSDPDQEMDDLDDEDDGTSTAPSLLTSGKSSHLKADPARRELLDLMRKDAARVAATLSTKEDAKQGRAVRQQQSAYDRLLDARIRLQKGVTASNSLTSEAITDSEAKEAVQKAEAAALALWSTIDSIRCDVLLKSASASPDSTTKKRKLPTPLISGSTLPLTDLWIHSKSLESHSLPHRRAVLDHWSNRTKASVPLHQNQSRIPGKDTFDPALSSVLDEYLKRELSNLVASGTALSYQKRNEENLSQTAAQHLFPPQQIQFSDDSFYQSLLRDLISSRTDNPLPNSTIPSSMAPARPAPINSQKNRLDVDTKASKGRKIRYTVHERLVSFMAPEDRSTWTEAARREFFSSLFGGRPLDNINADNEEMDGEENKEFLSLLDEVTARDEGALRLFSS